MNRDILEIESIEKEIKVLSDKLEEKKKHLSEKQSKCFHSWGETEAKRLYKAEPLYKDVWQGSDCFPEIYGQKAVPYDLYTRVCERCGKIETTTKTYPTRYEPDFK